MEKEQVIWDFCEKPKDKAAIYEFYHINSEHTPRTQSFNAPKLDYKLPELQPKEKECVWVIPCLEDIEDTKVTLKEALMRRRTSWNFRKNSITDKELETFIAYSMGINNKQENLKTYPSGGRLYPINCYFIPTKKVVGSNGIFKNEYCLKYNVHTRKMEKQSEYDRNEVNTLISATDIGTSSFDDALFLICLAGDAELMKKKYHSLTYRLMHDECGHIGQNICLAATMLGLSVVPLGGFFEERIRKMLDIDKRDERVLYVLAVG